MKSELLWESNDLKNAWTAQDPFEQESDCITALNSAVLSPRSSKSSSPSPVATKTKKVSKKKDPLRIKKPLNSFFLYRKKMREKIIAEHNVTAHQQISKIAASLWAAEPPHIKQQYQMESLEEFEKHKRLHPDYLWPHRGSKNADLQGGKASGSRLSLKKNTVTNINQTTASESVPQILKPTPRRADRVVVQDPSHIITPNNTILIPLNENKSHYPCPHGSRRRAYCILCGGTFTCVHLKRKDQCKICCKLPKGVCVHGDRQGDCRVCKYREVCKHYCDPGMCGDCYTGGTIEFKLAPILVKDKLSPLHQLASFASTKCVLPPISSLITPTTPSILTHNYTPPRQGRTHGGKILVPFYEYEGECVHKLSLSKCFLCDMESTCVHMRVKRNCGYCRSLPRDVCMHRLRMYDCEECRYREVDYSRIGQVNRHLPTPTPTPEPRW